MGRHRIEIEFDADVEDAEDWFAWVSEEAGCHMNVSVEMTPVFAHPQFCNPGCPANCGGREPT